MSWASHNPELYDEICEHGITHKLTKTLDEMGFIGLDDMTISAIGTLLYYKDIKIRNAVLDWANDEINNGEKEYWSDRIDEAKMRKDNGNL